MLYNQLLCPWEPQIEYITFNALFLSGEVPSNETSPLVQYYLLMSLCVYGFLPITEALMQSCGVTIVRIWCTDETAPLKKDDGK